MWHKVCTPSSPQGPPFDVACIYHLGTYTLHVLVHAFVVLLEGIAVFTLHAFTIQMYQVYLDGLHQGGGGGASL